MNRPVEIMERAEPALFTADEFLHMVDVGAFADMSVELDNGQIVRMSPSQSRHGLMIGRLTALLAPYGGSGRLAVDTFLRLGEQTVRAFDISILHEGVVPGEVLTPAEVGLGIEVSDSTLDTDLGPKQRDYAAAGIPHYWVVDVAACAVHVMAQPEGEAYRSRSVVRFGEPLHLPDGAVITL